MDDSRFDALATALFRSRRTLLGTAVAATSTAVGNSGAVSKKKKKKCKAPTTKCGKKRCCQPGDACVNGQCEAPTTPTPLTAISCPGPKTFSVGTFARYAQIFEATGTGLIATASFELASIAADTPIGVEIRTTQNGAPTSTVLGTAIIFGLPASASTLTLTAIFAPKVAVEQGQTYALVIMDVANKDFVINGRNPGECPWPFFIDTNGNNTFAPNPKSLIFTVSP
jgi:hypothetical protein